MTSSRPYLLRALFEWIVDNALIPHILVDTTIEHVEVPQAYIEDNKIILNIDPAAVKDLDIGNEYLSFSARFAGKAEHILTPVMAIQAIYAKENGQGMMFTAEEPVAAEAPDSERPREDAKVQKGRPSLKVIK